ncbi:hypothetical protein MUK42_26593 [Musa troglodytarum]|uniref:Uncharacterized protein n=1 Tax=Musa troglodytarum TaxID=320322 RepID=A0A9E7GMN9_9LILI|nr:hypothetical protein MUK42_26593 [Musa troglodytarum]
MDVFCLLLLFGILLLLFAFSYFPVSAIRGLWKDHLPGLRFRRVALGRQLAALPSRRRVGAPERPAHHPFPPPDAAAPKPYDIRHVSKTTGEGAVSSSDLHKVSANSRVRFEPLDLPLRHVTYWSSGG